MHQWATGHSVRNEQMGNGSFSDAIQINNTYTTIGTTTFTWEYFMASIYLASSTNALLDIGIDVGGNVFKIVDSLRLCSLNGPLTHGCDHVGFPIHVPAGSALVAKISAGNPRMGLHGFSHGINGAPGFSRAVALYTPSSDRGVTVDCGGTAHTRVRQEIIASTPADVHALLCSIGPVADTARAIGVFRFDIEMGAAGQEQSLVKNLNLRQDATFDSPYSPLGVMAGMIPCRVPAGSRMSVNAQCSINTAGDRTFDFAALGFVP